MESLEKALPITDPGHFPKLGEGIEFVRARQTAKTGSWHKGVFLVNVTNNRTGKVSQQIRMLGWQKNKKGEWKQRQKMNIPKGKADDIAEVLLAFHQS